MGSLARGYPGIASPIKGTALKTEVTSKGVANKEGARIGATVERVARKFAHKRVANEKGGVDNKEQEGRKSGCRAQGSPNKGGVFQKGR